MIERKDLPLFLKEVIEAMLPILPHFKITSRIEHDERSTRIFFIVKRPQRPCQEIAKMDVEFIYTLNTKKEPGIDVDTHIYILASNLTDQEIKGIVLLHAMCGLTPYEFLNQK